MYRNKKSNTIVVTICLVVFSISCTNRYFGHTIGTEVTNFDQRWEFHLGDMDSATVFKSSNLSGSRFDTSLWKMISLPHDWSIDGAFSAANPATNQGGALPGGTGWYRKAFVLPEADSLKNILIRFDGIYRNSEVWINGHYLGKRPNGFISFTYTLTPYIYFDAKPNRLVVKVDNSEQPNARWYTGSGINRDVWLIKKDPLTINQDQSFFYATVKANDSTTSSKADSPQTKDPDSTAVLTQELVLDNTGRQDQAIQIKTTIYDARNFQVAQKNGVWKPLSGRQRIRWDFPLRGIKTWSPEHPYLYTWEVEIRRGSHVLDKLRQPLGIRHFRFDSTKGFFLNGKHVRIKGVCLHCDWGSLGTAYHYSAMKRQLKLLKEMGCNAIRTAHNPPPPGMLSLCDSMGFLVMDEAFDVWQKKKNKYDYSLDFKEWHERDLEDQVKRDRNHPSVFMWSIGNEIREQFDTSGTRIARELTAMIKSLDPTRPVTSAMTEMDPGKNNIAKAGVLDVLGFNYKSAQYDSLPINFPGQKFIASETTSALETRDVYPDSVPDTTVFWPASSKDKYVTDGSPDWTVMAYDRIAAYWGVSHEKAWLDVKSRDFMAGIFVWSGIDYLGEPVPYPYPARSSYYGIIDLAGLPKDVYYLYQSEWTNKPVLHLFPHWNWKRGQTIDVWAYYSQADEVELYLNGKSLGKRHKGDASCGSTALHVSWKVPFHPGTLKVISRKKGSTVLTREVKTAGGVAKVEINADQSCMRGMAGDLCYVTLRLTDAKGVLVPVDDRKLQISIKGPATLVGLDNGYQADLSSFQKGSYRTWKGKLVAIIQTKVAQGPIELECKPEGLPDQRFDIYLGQ